MAYPIPSKPEGVRMGWKGEAYRDGDREMVTVKKVFSNLERGTGEQVHGAKKRSIREQTPPGAK